LQGRPTGTGRYLRNLLRVWIDSDDRLIVYFNGPAPPEPLLGHRRVVSRPLGTRPRRGLVFQELILPSRAKADSLDVFFAPAYSCPWSLDVPRVTAVHDLSFWSFPQDFSLLDGMRRRALVNGSLSVSSAILACSEFTRREILSLRSDVARRVFHVPLGPADDIPRVADKQGARTRLGITGPLVLTVGAILNRRCLPVLLRAMALLLKRWPSAQLIVVGENRTHPPIDFHSMIWELGITRSVRLLGFVADADLADCYAAADMAVFLSEYEGFGLPALEAMSHGLPVVVSERPSLGEIFGEAALVTNPRSVPAVAGALERLLTYPDLRAEVGARASSFASTFSWRTTGQRTREILASVSRKQA